MGHEKHIGRAMNAYASSRDYNKRRKDGYGRGGAFATTAVQLGAYEATNLLTRRAPTPVKIVAGIAAGEATRAVLIPKIESRLKRGPANSRRIDKAWENLHPRQRGMLEGAELALTGTGLHALGRASGSKFAKYGGATLMVAGGGLTAGEFYYYRKSKGKRIRVRNGRRRRR